MSRMIFEYPTELDAQERATAFRSFSGARVRLAGRRVGVIFVPAGQQEADELLDDTAYVGTTVSWEPMELYDGPMTLGGGIAAVFAGYAVGAVTAVLRRLLHWREGIQDRTISLHLNPGRGI